MGLTSFTSIAGVPVHYDRDSDGTGFGYGTRGRPAKFRASDGMLRKLNDCFSQIFMESDFGQAEVITSAGAFVGKPGYHGSGNAFDLDGIFWEEKTFIALKYPSSPWLYLALESVIRQHFGTVLGYNYNDAHKDHLHLDVGSSVGFNKASKSRVEYLQASLSYIHGYQLGIDGVWGPATEGVVKLAWKELGIGGTDPKSAWIQYLKVTASAGFEIAG